MKKMKQYGNKKAPATPADLKCGRGPVPGIDVAGGVFKKFANNESGAIAVMFALMLPVIMGVVGLGIDAGMWFKERRSMQTATDAAAVSAASERAIGATHAEMDAIARIEAAKHGFDGTTDTLALNSNYVHGGVGGHVEVVIVHPLNTFLSQIISSIVPESTTRAVATTVGGNDACFLSLAGTGTGIDISNASVAMNGCGVFANSTSIANPNQSIKVSMSPGSGDTLSVDCLWSAGAVDGTVGTVSTPVVGQDIVVADDCKVMESVPTVKDPFADLAVPIYGGCDINANITGGTLTGSGNLNTPKVICADIKLTGGTLNIDPGVYVLDGGSIDISGNAAMNATGVTFILANTISGTYGGVSITGTGVINWSAPTLADYAAAAPIDGSTDNYMGVANTNYTGIALFQSAPTPPTPSSNYDVKVTGTSDASVSGAIYVPNNDVSFGGTAGIMPSNCLQLVSNTLTISGDAAIQNDCAIYGGNPVEYGTKPGLVE